MQKIFLRKVHEVSPERLIVFLVDDGALVVAVKDLRELFQREDASLIGLNQPCDIILE